MGYIYYKTVQSEERRKFMITYKIIKTTGKG